ncbi:hypothetical protein OROMI_020356 [Orobanche minor]
MNCYSSSNIHRHPMPAAFFWRDLDSLQSVYPCDDAGQYRSRSRSRRHILAIHLRTSATSLDLRKFFFTMNTISEITPVKETWKLHVRVERLWTTHSPYNPTEKRSMELILLDAKDVIAEGLNVGDIVELNKNGQCTKRVTIHLLDSICVKYLRNSMFATRMLINEDVSELADFINSIKENNDAHHLTSKQSLSHGSDALSDDFSTLLQFKSICELDSTTEEYCCLIIAKILNIDTNYNWFYGASNKCFKKVSVLDKSCWCEKCKMRPTSILTRYKVNLRVEDESETTSFVPFDHQVYQILGKSAADIKQTLDLVI